MSEKAYFQDVVSSLELPEEAITLLDQNNVTTFEDLRRKGLFDDVLEKCKVTDENVTQAFRAHLDHSTISTDFEMNTKVIEKGYMHPDMISNVSRDAFIEDLKTYIGEYQSALYYDKAIAQYRYKNNSNINK